MLKELRLKYGPKSSDLFAAVLGSDMKVTLQGMKSGELGELQQQLKTYRRSASRRQDRKRFCYKGVSWANYSSVEGSWTVDRSSTYLAESAECV